MFLDDDAGDSVDEIDNDDGVGDNNAGDNVDDDDADEPTEGMTPAPSLLMDR